MMRRKATAVVPLLFAIAVAHAQTQAQAPDATTQDPTEALQQLLSTAMTVSINARIVPPDPTADAAAPLWNAESTKLTIPGRSIRVRLEGDKVRIYLICTPYVQEDGTVLLLAQGQVWFSATTDKESTYSGTYYAIPMTYGTPVFFYPLGVSEPDPQQKGFFNIEVEIRIERGFDQKPQVEHTGG
ncbi:MAG TPA: hypothetical protein VL359_05055 [bacterium]|nr:hypothetical protein [bacterium]